jgi:hypothetical protein
LVVLAIFYIEYDFMSEVLGFVFLRRKRKGKKGEYEKGEKYPVTCKL